MTVPELLSHTSTIRAAKTLESSFHALHPKPSYPSLTPHITQGVTAQMNGIEEGLNLRLKCSYATNLLR